jgi:hypothetical protein
MDDPGQPFTPGNGQTYAEDRRRRLHRGRVVGFSVCIALWLLSAVPLARLSSDEGGGADVAAAYLGTGLGIAIVSRGIYAWRTRRPFWSPWLFLTAAVLAIVSYAVQSAGDKAFEPESRGAAQRTVAERHIQNHGLLAMLHSARRAYLPSGETEEDVEGSAPRALHVECSSTPCPARESRRERAS